MRSKQQLKHTAYHEAGHAVVAYCLKSRIRHVSIISKAESLGHILKGKSEDLSSCEWETTPKIRRGLEKSAMIDLGGSVATYLLTNRNDRIGPRGDFQHAFDYLSYLTNDDDESSAYANWLWHRTKAMLRWRWHWAAVEALANELLEHRYIGGKRARQIISETIHKMAEKEAEEARKKSIESAKGREGNKKRDKMHRKERQE
jgi:hypothetical protein